MLSAIPFPRAVHRKGAPWACRSCSSLKTNGFCATASRHASARPDGAFAEARTGEAAVSLLEAREHIDIAFTDIRLAGTISGWDVGSMYRRAHPRMPVVYTSGDPVALALAVPNSRFIAKPYEPGAVIDACRTYFTDIGSQC